MPSGIWAVCITLADNTVLDLQEFSCLLKQQLEARLETWDISSSPIAHTCVSALEWCPWSKPVAQSAQQEETSTSRRLIVPVGLCYLLIWLSWKVETVLLLCSIRASADHFLERWGFQAAKRRNAIMRPKHHLLNTKGFGKWGCVSVWLTPLAFPKSMGRRQLDLDSTLQ